MKYSLLNPIATASLLTKPIASYAGARHGGKPVGALTATTALDQCLGRAPGMRARIESLRAQSDPAQQKKQKLVLPADTWAYAFRASPSKALAVELDRVSGLIALDFDGLEAAQARELVQALRGDPHTVAAFLSPRGAGVRVLSAWVPAAPIAQAYAHAEQQAIDYYAAEYGATADSAARGIARLSFRSYDPKGALNDTVTPFMVPADAPAAAEYGATDSDDSAADPVERSDAPPAPVDPADAALAGFEDRQEIERLRDALAWVNPAFDGAGDVVPGVGGGRQTWVRIGIALKRRFQDSPEAHALFHAWSRGDLRRKSATWPKGVPTTYGSEAIFETQWRSFPLAAPAGEASASVALVYKIAQALGWSRADRGAVDQSEPTAENWESYLRRSTKGVLKSCDYNADLVLRFHSVFTGKIRWNEFLCSAEASVGLPWTADRDADAAWTDHDDKAAALAISGLYAPAVMDVLSVSRAVENVAKRARFHPVRDWLTRLRWDGVARLNGWLGTVFGCAPSAYVAAVGAKTLIAAVARVCAPGSKVDTMLVVGGFQGLGKSTVFRALAGDEWFSDAELAVGTKDAAQLLRGSWIYEMGELHTLRRAEVTLLKSYLSRQIDRQRDAFERHVVARPRQNIFVGTTNRQEYLTDDTGNRRFWPVWAKKADVEWVVVNREQLWAEAHARYVGGEKWWLEGAVEREAQRVQEHHVEQDPWDDLVRAYVENGGEFGNGKPLGEVSATDIYQNALRIPAATGQEGRRLASVMRRLGWRGRLMKRNNSVFRGYVRGESAPDEGEGNTGGNS